MAENNENTLTSYLGHDFQLKLFWQLLVEPEFAEKTLDKLEISYFDDPILKKLFIICLEYRKEYGKVPNLQNNSIRQAINQFKSANNIIEEETLFAVLKKIMLWNEMIINRKMMHDGDAIQSAILTFIKQQEYRKLGEIIIYKTQKGEIKQKQVIGEIEDKFRKITEIGQDDDDCEEVIDNIDSALRKEFRQTIPTGIEVIDAVTGGGLGKSEIGIILAPSGVGKAQPLSSKILTPNGWVTMGDVKVNDEVIGSDGKSQKVLAVYPQGVRPIYKIKFNDDTSTYCDEEHLWSVNSLNDRTFNTSKYINGKRIHIKKPRYDYKPKTLKEILGDYKKSRNGVRNKLNYRIPIVQPIEFNENNDLLIDPYLLGILIGDGGLTNNSVKFTSVDLSIIKNISEIVNRDFKELSVKKVSNTITYGITGLTGYKNKLNTYIKDYGLNVKSLHKFIPKDYKYSIVKDRILLLQGLLDSDGYASKQGRIQFASSSKRLTDDVREIVLSLGGFCKIKTKKTGYRKNGEYIECELSYIATISFSNEEIKPFQLERKQERVIYRKKYAKNKYISNIEYSHNEEAQCIYVENEDHLYVTDDFILTHNTTALTKIANTAYELDYNVAQIIFEDTKDQIKRKHYTIWTDIALSAIDGRLDETKEKVQEKISSLSGRGKLIIKRFNEEDTTMIDVKNWMISYEKKYGLKFDLLVLDYLDCLESHKKTNDRNEAELVIVKSFERLAAELNIPAWSAIQSNRSGFDAEFVEAQQTGGSIKRVQKAHFFMSIAKTPDQKEANLANFKIIKARFATDGQTFKDAIYNNDTMEIRIEDSRYKNNGMYSEHRKYRDEDFNAFNEKAGILHAQVSNTSTIVEEAKVVEDKTLLGDMMTKYAVEKNIEIKVEEKPEKSETYSNLASMYGIGKESVGDSPENAKIIDDKPNIKTIDDGDLLNFDFDYVETERKHITPDWVGLTEEELERARKDLPKIEMIEENENSEIKHVKHDNNKLKEMLIKKRKTKSIEKNE